MSNSTRNINSLSEQELRDLLSETAAHSAGYASKKITDKVVEEHRATRGFMTEVFGHGLGDLGKKLKGHTSSEADQTRSTIRSEADQTRSAVRDEGSNTRSHIDRRADEILDKCGARRLPGWAIAACAIIGILAAIGAAMACWPSIEGLFCYTLDAAGNTVPSTMPGAAGCARIVMVLISACAGWAAYYFAGWVIDYFRGR